MRAGRQPADPVAVVAEQQPVTVHQQRGDAVLPVGGTGPVQRLAGRRVERVHLLPADHLFAEHPGAPGGPEAVVPGDQAGVRLDRAGRLGVPEVTAGVDRAVAADRDRVGAVELPGHPGRGRRQGCRQVEPLHRVVGRHPIAAGVGDREPAAVRPEGRVGDPDQAAVVGQVVRPERGAPGQQGRSCGAEVGQSQPGPALPGDSQPVVSDQQGVAVRADGELHHAGEPTRRSGLGDRQDEPGIHRPGAGVHRGDQAAGNAVHLGELAADHQGLPAQGQGREPLVGVGDEGWVRGPVQADLRDPEPECRAHLAEGTTGVDRCAVRRRGQGGHVTVQHWQEAGVEIAGGQRVREQVGPADRAAVRKAQRGERSADEDPVAADCQRLDRAVQHHRQVGRRQRAALRRVRRPAGPAEQGPASDCQPDHDRCQPCAEAGTDQHKASWGWGTVELLIPRYGDEHEA